MCNRHTCYTELKRRIKNISIKENQDTIEQTTTIKESSALTLEDQKVYIQKAMEQMKSDEALVLRLFYLCEMSLSEIETITKFSASKIRVDLHRGRKNIKRELEFLLGDEIKYFL
ncbi:sigma-70 family RNA polymerase sigma factor [Maribacter sp. PR1]|uniref:Sigma-70 family RNA polymerase sigma factor n=1 Tax=Maribacter cobaltidurans TaxID=1178778 RepID=A0ABU7IYE9_9FLAO|nr:MULTISPECIES: sigma-70 family RNA polymerase sigma factor [Maribacter]MDC6390474.1 sigma-70 family RNA polymerase sigma factor [Maribacter sp. PR1]MEE1977863.1 sigma-70 family RNA polymerase sigma factor [Maribacter cobaltidurans]